MNLVEILNTIRDNASSEYQNRVPEATRTNLAEIQNALVGEGSVQTANEFMSVLLNKVIKSVVHNKVFKNPLKALKKGKKPLGDTIEEIFTNFAKGHKPDQVASDLLARTLPDTKAVYHRKNYEMQYEVTIDRTRLTKAFSSWENLDTYINSIITSLYNGAEKDEFLNMKELLKIALDNKALKVISVKDPLVSEANGKEFIKVVKAVSGYMTFPSTEYNSYLTAQTKDKKAIETFSAKNEQVLIIDVATDTSVNVDVLASLFNMSVADFNDTKKIVIDHFPIKGARCALVDEAFFQIFDDLYEITSFYNGKGLYTNYYLNVFQTLAYSILVNSVVFVSEDEVETTEATAEE